MNQSHLYFDGASAEAANQNDELVLPWYFAVAFIAVLSVSVWAVIWNLGGFAIALAQSWFGG